MLTTKQGLYDATFDRWWHGVRSRIFPAGETERQISEEDHSDILCISGHYKRRRCRRPPLQQYVVDEKTDPKRRLGRCSGQRRSFAYCSRQIARSRAVVPANQPVGFHSHVSQYDYSTIPGIYAQRPRQHFGVAHPHTTVPFLDDIVHTFHWRPGRAGQDSAQDNSIGCHEEIVAA